MDGEGTLGTLKAKVESWLTVVYYPELELRKSLAGREPSRRSRNSDPFELEDCIFRPGSGGISGVWRLMFGKCYIPPAHLT